MLGTAQLHTIMLWVPLSFSSILYGLKAYILSPLLLPGVII